METSNSPAWLDQVPVISSPELARLASEVQCGRLSDDEAEPLILAAAMAAIEVAAVDGLGDALLAAVCPTEDTPMHVREMGDAKHPRMVAIKDEIEAGRLSMDDAKAKLVAAFRDIVSDELRFERIFVN
jgi:hypothetical protein